MSTKDVQCSEISLPELGGLVINLIQKLTGKRARFWFRALKLLDRKQNPWIPFRKILRVASGGYILDHVKVHLKDLEELGINVFDCMHSITDSKVVHLEKNQHLPEHDIVLVKLGDLFTLEERTTGDYQKLLDKASEHGLEPCGLREGFAAAVVLVKEAKSGRKNSLYPHYIICTELFETEGDSHERLPKIAIKSGDRSDEKDSQGMMTMYAFNARTKGVVYMDDIENPETLLLFRSVPW